MQPGNLIAELRPQPLGQVFREQRMVTIPSAFLIEGHEQQLTRLDRLKQLAARARSRHMLAERCAEPVEDRRTQHELHEFAWQSIEQFPKISADRALRAGEIAHVLPEVLRQFDRSRRGDSQGCRPALRLLMQESYFGRNERTRFLCLEESLRFLQI